MRKIVVFFLLLALCLSLTACGGTGNKDHDYILHLLEQGEYDMAIHVIEGLKSGKTDPAQQQQSPASNERILELVPETNGSDWLFHMDIFNQTAHTLTLDTVLIIDRMDEQELGTSGFEGADLNRLDLGGLVLKPGDGRGWDDAFPVRDAQFNQREYLFVFNDEQGEKVRFSFPFDMRGMMPNGPMDSGNQPQESSGDWTFPVVLENTGDTPWELKSMDITHFMDNTPLGTMIFEGADLGNIGLGGLILQPGQRQNYIDGHPVVSDWNAAEYRFYFMDGNRQQQILTFRFDDLDKQNQAVDYSQDSGKDLKTLRHDAAFEVEVSDGVYWVPAVTLGSSRYSNAEIHKMLSATPEEKQGHISTLYEALQLYQVGNFAPSDDNVRMFDGGIMWEHHKPGYHAVRTNTGCCATDSNWLRYILDGDYEEVGYIATSQRDGSGHIYNYLLHEGWYYIIDLTHYHASGPLVTALESGQMNDYYRSDYILGNIHKVKNIQDYVNYVQRAFNDPPGLMFMYTAENCLAVDGNDRQIMYEDTGKPFVDVIFDDTSDLLDFVWKPAPKSMPDWNHLP